MRLTAYTDYTRRALMYLAVDIDRLATIAEIAKAYHISATHPMKVVHALGVSGEVETVRGRNGGMRLAKSAASINLGSIVRRTEADMVLVPCIPMCAALTERRDTLSAEWNEHAA
jgi:Rrf2 family transcriptional regulator, nitric oxide-sensitive transcriptional repressor